jgi:hypothetical protein
MDLHTKIEAHILENELKQAVSALLQESKQSLAFQGLHHDLLSLNAELEKLVAEEMDKTIGQEQAQVAYNILRKRILYFNDKFREKATASGQESEKNLEDLESLIHTHFSALQSKKYDLLWRTFHSEAPQLVNTIEFVKHHMADVSIYYSIHSIDPILIGSDSAVLRITQLTEGHKSNPSFKDNLVVQLWLFKKEQQHWRVYGSIPMGFEYLEK